MTIHPELQRAINAARANRPGEAAELLNGFLKREPSHVPARWMLVQVLESLQENAAALGELHSLLLHVKRDLPAIDRIAGHFLQKRYPLNKVLGAYRKYLAHEPGSANAHFNYAYYLGKDAQFKLAIEMYQRALQRGIDTPEEVHLNMANIYMDHLQDHAAAKQHLHDALAINPAYSSAYYNLGNLAERAGEREEAARCFQKCLELDPPNESALARLADTHRFTDENEPLLAELHAKAKRSRNADLLMAAGKASEQLRDFDTAWRYFAMANEQDERLMPVYRREATETMFNGIMQQCNREWMARFAGQSQAGIFVCGMFRTGSTLLEQVLAAHPAFTAGGEREFFPRLIAREFPAYPHGLDALAKDRVGRWREEHLAQTTDIFGGAARVTDKRPDNFLYLGLIKAVLPSAKFIVTERDWRDVATSIFSVRLGSTQSYATRLRNIRHYIKLQTRLVGHWERVLGDDLKRIRYEDLVGEPKQTIGNLLQWLGQEWDERCLSFHNLRNSVSTASVWQVREPLHVKSVGRWRNYEAQFREVFGDELDT